MFGIVTADPTLVETLRDHPMTPDELSPARNFREIIPGDRLLVLNLTHGNFASISRFVTRVFAYQIRNSNRWLSVILREEITNLES